MNKSSSALYEQEAQAVVSEKPITLYRLFWLFVISSFIGDVIEVIFCLITQGVLMSRSSLVFGPFSLVWGLGAVLLTVALHPLRRQSSVVLFAGGAVLGGVYEYVCSWFQEWAFGACFWDYSHLPFNLNGRINLLFCLFWGVLAVAWVRLLCPLLCRFIDRITRDHARRLTIAVAAFFLLSTSLSAAALVRMDRRQEGIPAGNFFAAYLDENFSDQWLHERYPNMGLLD